MIGQGTFREVVRSVNSAYQTTLIIALLFAFAVVCFGMSILSPAFAWFFLVLSTFTCVVALATIVWAVFFRPELLRSEHNQLTARALDMLDDSELPETSQTNIQRLVQGFSEPKTFMPPDQDARSEGDADA